MNKKKHRVAWSWLLALLVFGLAPVHAQTKIVGGTEAAAGAWPWAAYVSSGLGNCGGTLVSQTKVITAAHCVVGQAASNVKVKIGSVDLASSSMKTYSVSTVAVHPDYNADLSQHDIAVLTLSSSVTGITTLKPADFALAISTKTMVIGWGKTSSGGSVVTKLRQAEVDVIDPGVCRANYVAYAQQMRSANPTSAEWAWKATWYPFMAYDLCAGILTGGVDACQGDSGGPLMQFVNGTWMFVGVVSWGEGCAARDLPGLYAGVSRFRPFLESQGVDFWDKKQGVRSSLLD